MARHQNIVRRGTQWVYRRRVPNKLRPIIDRYDIRKSLRTGDFQEACRRARQVALDVDAMFDAARRKLDAQQPVHTSLEDDDIRHLALQWFTDYDTQRAADERASDHDPETRAELIHVYETDEGWLSDSSDPNTLASVQQDMRAVLKQNGIEIDTASPEFWSLFDALRRANVEASRRARQRLNGDHSGRTLDRLFDGVGVDAPLPDRPQELRLRELAQLYKKEHHGQGQARRVGGVPGAGRNSRSRQAGPNDHPPGLLSSARHSHVLTAQCPEALPNVDIGANRRSGSGAGPPTARGKNDQQLFESCVSVFRLGCARGTHGPQPGRAPTGRR